MDEYIEREAIAKLFESECRGECVVCPYDDRGDCTLMNQIPPADVQPVKHGKWLDLWVEDDEIIGGGFMIKQCSVCKEEMYYGEPRYCPDCGAKMDGET